MVEIANSSAIKPPVFRHPCVASRRLPLTAHFTLQCELNDWDSR